MLRRSSRLSGKTATGVWGCVTAPNEVPAQLLPSGMHMETVEQFCVVCVFYSDLRRDLLQGVSKLPHDVDV